MTKKDYELIAKAMRASLPVYGESEIEWQIKYNQWVLMVHDMMDYLVSENPRFNRDTFWKACNN